MKSLLAAAITAAVLLVHPAVGQTCEAPASVAALTPGSKVIKDFFGPIEVPITPQTFFCAGDKIVLHWFDINQHTDLSHSMTFEAVVENCSENYPADWFEAFYAQVAAAGTVEVLISLYETVEITGDECRRVLHEFVEIVDAACLFQEQQVILEKQEAFVCM